MIGLIINARIIIMIIIIIIITVLLIIIIIGLIIDARIIMIIGLIISDSILIDDCFLVFFWFFFEPGPGRHDYPPSPVCPLGRPRAKGVRPGAAAVCCCRCCDCPGQ